MDYKQIVPSIFLKNGEAVEWPDKDERITDDPVQLALNYANYGADSIIVFDLSEDSHSHAINIGVIRNICRTVDIPVIGSGNVGRLEDIKRMIYAGCYKACLNFTRRIDTALTEDAGRRFGREHIAIAVDNVGQLEAGTIQIKNYVSEIILIGSFDLESCTEWVTKNCTRNVNPINMGLIPVFSKKTFHDAAAVLRSYEITGISGGELNYNYREFMNFKRQCKGLGVSVNSFESKLSWSDFKLNSDGMIPVVVQDYKNNDVLMLAYMNEKAYNATIQSGIMTYWSRSRNELWVKGDTSGHYQYVKSLTADCDNDTILAKVYQVGAACHTGSRSCFFNEMVSKEFDKSNPMEVFNNVYRKICESSEAPGSDSYTNYMFDKGIDKLLKKLGEECTEIIVAAKNPDPEEIKYSMADWLYNAMILMSEKGVTWEDVSKEIAHR